MVKCGFCGEEFSSEHKLHLHWGREHEDELNSHQKEKVKRAERQEKERSEEKRKKFKRYGIIGSAGALLLGIAVLAGPSVVNFFSGPQVSEEKLKLEEQPVLGNPDADNKVIEFGDYLCGACRTFELSIKPQIQDQINSGEVAFYFVDKNLPQFSPENQRASVAAQCVLEQNQTEFWRYHKALYQQQNQISYDEEGLTTLAEETTESVNITELKSCIGKEKTIEAVETDNEIARDIGVTSTPRLYLNGNPVGAGELQERLE